MKQISKLMAALPEFEQLQAAYEAGASPILLSGSSAGLRAPLAAALRQQTGAPLVLVCADEREATALLPDLEALCGEAPAFLPAREFSFHPGTASHQWEHRRLGIFRALIREEVPLLVVSMEALLQRTLPPNSLTLAARSLAADGSYSLPDLAEHLAAIGYTRCEQVEGVGQFSLRGGILDFFSPQDRNPVRVEFWGDAVDSMSSFDPQTQRRLQSLKQADILPASEVVFLPDDASATAAPDLLLPLAYKEVCSAADYLPQDAIILLCETPRLQERARSYLWQLEEDVKSLLEGGAPVPPKAVYAKTTEQLYAQLADWPLVYLDTFTSSSYPLKPRSIVSLLVKQLPGLTLSIETTEEDLLQYRREGYRSLILVGSERRADHLQEKLRERKLRVSVDYGLHSLPRGGDIVICVGALAAGLELPSAKIAILTEGGVAPAPKSRRKAPQTNRQKLESFSDLSLGDLVVHEHHGIGRFSGMVQMQVDGIDKDYVKLQFSGADVLYVPAIQLDLVSKYIGGGEDSGARRLSKLGGIEWEKAKTRAKKAAKDLAKGLILLYAQRQRQPGFAFSPDSPWQREFEDQFPHPETDDQLRCVEEIKLDMERSIPMDRLLCGDVGYGKTEVALRAVMKCVLDGKQAAILAPTTVLAQQHFLTALQRFRHFPITVEMISRARTSAQSRDILQRTKDGSVDLLIGTHKLLQKVTPFKDLGLLVVDEEQRFGVTHKERLKELFRQVDVLILSATPIPRTLNMALSGLRDMSTLEEPPHNRRPVQTYVLEHDWGVLADSMRRELARGGQIFYLHNRVESIDGCAARIAKLLPEARIAVAHGKMPQDALNEIMREMRDNELDILVCTTIIETGVDLPNVNTLIVEDADHLGLSQLHQLRGRVGRSSRRAYAYMSYRRGKVLTEIAERRLSAIREFAAFGSGFKIAMRDLEIRGAGNLLGPEQSGFLMSVGYDMYLRLLEEAVLEEQGTPTQKPAECAADISVAASIPASYITSPEQRMDVYRRIARVRDEEMADEMLEEIIDRYGDPPRAVSNLISIALLRCMAAACGITELAQKENLLRFSLPKPDLERVFALCGMEKYRNRLLFSAGDKPHLALRLRTGDDILRLVRVVLTDLLATYEVPAQNEA